MNDTERDNKPKSAQDADSELQQKPVAATKPPKARSRGFLWFCVLLLMGGTGALGWFVWQQQAIIETLQAAQQSTGSREAAMLSRLQAVESIRQTLEEELQVNLQQQSTELAALASQQEERLSSLQQDMLNLRLQRNTEVPTPPEVLLAEARGLLRLGRERLLADQDVEIALSLYLSADEVLSLINDPGVQLIRQTLLRETDSLRGVRKPDIAGMYAEIGRLKEVVNTLPLASGASAATAGLTPPDNEPQEAAAGWVDSLKQGLSRYFVISRQAEPVRPRVTEEGMALIRLDISLQLEQARLALLQENVRLYQQAIDAAAGAIASWAVNEDAAPLLASLESLRNAPIAPNLPPLGAALNAVRSLESGTLENAEQR